MDLLQQAKAISPGLVRLRHRIHREPEIGLLLPRTQQKVKAALGSLPVDIVEGKRLSSIVAVLRGDQPGPTTLLRADMDALPITEEATTRYRSRYRDTMHACGHDLHTTMLVGAARLLTARRSELAGTVVFMFQPGEEGWDGAQKMIDEGVLTAAGRVPDAAYALHVVSGHPHGVFATKPGLVFAASDRLRVTVRGQGGHVADPRGLRDPVLAASRMVEALYSPPVRRSSDISERAIFMVGAFHAGVQPAIRPASATFEATLRTYSPAARKQATEWARLTCNTIAASHGLHLDLQFTTEYPVTRNAESDARFAADLIRDLFGSSRFNPLSAPLAAAEDFSRILEVVPGAMITLGAAPVGQDHGSLPFNHSPYAVFDDGVLADGAALYAALALRRPTLASFTSPVNDGGSHEQHQRP